MSTPAPTAIGIPFDQPLPEVIERARIAEAQGVDEIWVAQMPDDFDAAVVAGAILAATSTVRVGLGVLPIHTRHPCATAQLAATLDDASGGRFMLGLGVSHPFVNDFLLGLSTGKPLREMREYVDIVRDLLRTGRVDRTGDYFTGRTTYQRSVRPDLPVLVGALRPRMAELAVRHSDGLLLWLTSPDYVEEHVLPTVHRALADTGRDPATFTMLALVPAIGPERTEERLDAARVVVGGYAMLPYYRRMWESAGYGGSLSTGTVGLDLVDRIAVVGDAERLRKRMAEFEAIGVRVAPAIGAPDRAGFAELTAAACGD